MNKSIGFYRSLRPLIVKRNKFTTPSRFLSSENTSSNGSITEELLGKRSDENVAKPKTLSFAEAFDKFEKLAEDSKIPKKPIDPINTERFPTLLRYSPYIQMGDPIGKIVVGRIEEVVEEDLYIDFGNKFNAVCKRPKINSSDYVRGAKVRLRINDLELSDRFLGSTKDMTLLEADATLLGLIWSPNKSFERNVESNS